MKIYRVHYYLYSDSSQRFEFFASRRAADTALNKHNREHSDNLQKEIGCVDEYEFKPTVKGILGLLGRVACHPYNG